MKLTIEMDTSAPGVRRADVVKHAEAAAALFATIARVYELAAIQAAPEAVKMPAAPEPKVVHRKTTTKADPVDGYNALAAAAGGATIPATPETPKAETVQQPEPVTPDTEAEPTPEAALPSPSATPEERRSHVKTAAVEKGILWVRANIMEPYKVTRMSDLTDAQIDELCAKIDKEPVA